MTLRGKKPDAIEKRLKALFYGCAGAGKTYASIQFPCPYLIDTERGAENGQYIELLKKQNGAIFQTTDYEELLAEVKALLTEKHPYKTLIIDPLTTVFNDMVDKAAESLITKVNPDGTAFGAHYGKANKQMKKLLNLLLRLDMNVIITSHSKTKYGENLTALGETFDCYKKLDYLFDLVIEITKNDQERLAFVRKSRIASLEENSQFVFSYQHLAELYGKDIIEKESKNEELATGEQINELKRLIDVHKVSKEIIDKWLIKAQATVFEEMETTKIQACIDYLDKKGQEMIAKKPESKSEKSKEPKKEEKSNEKENG